MENQGGMKSDGTRCSVHDFSNRMNFEKSKHQPNENQIKLIMLSNLTDAELIKNIDDSEFHEWYEVGTEKYGRRMYCPMTNQVRSTTMGEFYQSSTVD